MTNKIRCPFCNELNEGDTKVCTHCGNKLNLDSNEKLYCPNCKNPVNKGQKKCKCGYELNFISAEKAYCLNC